MMTNPVDDNTELENVDPAEDVCAADNDSILVSEEEEIINEYDIKPKKKTLALEARHRIEELTQLKKIKDDFFYFDEDDSEYEIPSKPAKLQSPLKNSKKKKSHQKKSEK